MKLYKREVTEFDLAGLTPLELSLINECIRLRVKRIEENSFDHRNKYADELKSLKSMLIQISDILK